MPKWEQDDGPHFLENRTFLVGCWVFKLLRNLRLEQVHWIFSVAVRA
jgi:hypothetical protein